MAAQSLEERVERLEVGMQKVQEDIASQRHGARAGKSGWRWFVGVFENAPEFDEVESAGREWREADRPQELPEGK